jgi:hypothetical protein
MHTYHTNLSISKVAQFSIKNLKQIWSQLSLKKGKASVQN